MADCCSASGCGASEGTAAKAACPACQQQGTRVAMRTLLHQLRFPENQRIAESSYYFCENPACERVYFSPDGTHYTQEQLRMPVGQKSVSPQRMLCYCFDISAQQVMDELQQSGHSPSKAFVVEKTKAGLCDCEIRNPSGRCCLKDFPS